MGILQNFQGDFWKNLQRITETSNNFIEKLQRNPKEILEIFGALLKICPGRFKALSGTENTANIFQNNILLVSPLNIYSMKTMFASLLVFLQRIYIENTISINIDKKKFSILPSLFQVESAGVNTTASVTLTFHSSLNEPKEVSLQNPNTLMEDDCTTLVVTDWTCHSPINLENEGRIEKC